MIHPNQHEKSLKPHNETRHYVLSLLESRGKTIVEQIV